MARVTVKDCLEILRSLMLRNSDELEKMDPMDYSGCQACHKAYFSLAEAYNLIRALRDFPKTSTNDLEHVEKGQGILSYGEEGDR